MALKCATVAELRRRMSSREFAEWQAFEVVDGPIGAERGDWHAAQMEATTINMWRAKGVKPVKIEQCLLKWGPPPRRQTHKEAMLLLKDWLRRNGIKQQGT